MFSRIKDALDRTIAEEQARLRPAAEQRTANTSTNDAAASPSTDPAKKPGQGGSTHPDPAVFEAAFRPEDDSDSARGGGTPVSSMSSETAKGVVDSAISEKNSSAQGQDGDTNKTAGADASQTPELPPQVKAKLRKLEKLEPNFYEVLRSYRIAHTQIKNFERVLQENTPLSTIKDPNALMDYLNEFTQKTDIAFREMRRVSTERDDLKKRADSSEAEIAVLKNELAALKEAAKTDVNVSPLNEARADKVPEMSDEQENMFSYDDEISKLQSELASQTEQMTKLELEINTLKEELAVANEQGASTVQGAQEVKLEPSESGDDGALAQPKSDTRDAEIKSLETALENVQEQLRNNEASLESERSLHASKAADVEMLEAVKKEKNAELEKLVGDNTQMTKQIASLNGQLEEYRKADATMKQQLQLARKTPEATAPTNGSSKKKNKKKKKGGASQTVAETVSSETSETTDPSSLESHEALTIRVSTLQESLDIRQKEKTQLLETIANLREDVSMLQQSLIDNGEDVTAAKRDKQELEEKVKVLQATNSESEKERETRKTAYATFTARIVELEKEIEGMGAVQAQLSEMEKRMKSAVVNTTESASKQEAEHESTKKALEESKIRSRTLQSDLGASQKLAQDRFKEITNMKEILAKAQTEMKSLRQDSSDLKTTREALTSKQNELRILEKREKELKNEVSRIQRLSSDRESEIKLLNDRLSAEKASRVKLEDEKRVLGRDYRRLDAEKAEIIARAEKASLDLETAQVELSSLRPKTKLLEDDVARLQKEKTLAKEEVDLKTQQYQNAQGLLASMRAENKELETQLKEAQNQAESLQEELAEAQKHLGERTRETETMRRRIKEENEKADARVRDMRAQMEAAIEDRDRIEDESSTLGRRRAREAEELKTRVRELERESKALRIEKEALEASEQQWRQRREELEQIEEKATAETEDMRSTVSSLRSALDASEQQVRDAEKQKANLRKLLDEAQGRYERTNKELKSVQSKLSLGSGPNATSGGLSTSTVKSGVDITYLKTVFLQFLEAEDGRVRLQLIPVILKLLGFDKNEEEKGTKTLQHLLGSNRK
ncbi:GRIP domain-containing protein [Xylaria longipes]|nr:GRIP domain-containing protein [Xylaria longipes]